MLKKLSVLFAIGSVLVLAACGGRAETTTVCVVNGINFYGEFFPGYMETEFEAVGDRVSVMRERLIFDFAGEEDSIDALVEILEAEIDLLRMMLVDGMTTELTSITDTTVTWETTSNFDEMSEEDLNTFLQDYDFISLEASVELNEEETGATCTVVDND